jgi:ribulose-phosphate 3-epimerase
MLISPSLLSSDLLNLKSEIESLALAGADMLHYDVMDGSYVPNLTFGPGILKKIKTISNLKLDVHLMTKRPQDLFQMFVDAGADRIAFHPEATDHPYRDIQTLKSMGAEACCAVNPGTNIDILIPLLHLLDGVLIMTVNPGFSGQHFLKSQLHKITMVRQLINQINPHCKLAIDGGINPETFELLRPMSPDIIVLGHAMFGNDGGLTVDDYTKKINYYKS